MIRIGYMSAALNLATAMVSFLRFGSNYALLIMLSYTLMFFACYRLLRSKGNLALVPALTVSCSFLIYNVVYVLLKQYKLADLYTVDWRLGIQLIVPLMLGLILKAILQRSGQSRLV